MSTLFTKGHEANYSEISMSMNMFSASGFREFLNTTQNGAAHSASGLDGLVFLRNIATSFLLCVLQLTVFCFLRPTCNSLYLPRCWYVPKSERVEPLPRGILSWLIPTIKCDIHHYLSMGLDAYFFIRFVSVMLLFFGTIGMMNLLVLIPINFTGSDSEYSALGLDKLSISNIATSKVHRLKAHFVMTTLTVVCFHWFLIHELQCFMKIRQSFLLTRRQKASMIQKTVLIENVPDKLLDLKVLQNIFLVLPGQIERLWFVYDYREIEKTVELAAESLDFLEEAEVTYLSNCMRTAPKSKSPKTPLFFPPIHLSVKIPYTDIIVYFWLPGIFRLARVDKFEWSLKMLEDQYRTIEDFKLLQVEQKLAKVNKVFIQFNLQETASIAHQCLLSQVQGLMCPCYTQVNPDDIIWGNLIRRNTIWYSFTNFLISVISLAVILIYVVPVSFIGLVSQLPLLTQLIPSLRWIYKLPEEIRDSVTSIIPAIALSVLTDILLRTFRFLTYYKGKSTGAELEVDLQKWYFAFLFVQQFLVVTILTSIISVFKQAIEQPISLTLLLAANLPKSATFFYQYIALKAFSFCGSNFLRINQLILHHTWHRYIDRTPRQVFRRLTILPKVKWGSIYPVYSVYCSIGLAYCLISPLISAFIVFILSLVVLYYKYALKYIYSHTNESETYGRLYPVALLNLYSGIYCLEICLIGIFFSLQNEAGEYPLRMEGFFMSIELLLTVFTGLTLYNKYVKHFSHTPILADKQYVSVRPEEEVSEPATQTEAETETLTEMSVTPSDHDFYLKKSMLYLHPALKYEKPCMWIPKDTLEESTQEIKKALAQRIGISSAMDEGATVQLRGIHRFVKLNISQAPPDFK